MKRALAGLAFVAAIGVTTVHTSRHLAPAGRSHPGRYGLEDFRIGFYYPAVAALDTVNPYDPDQFLAAYPVARSFPPYPPTMILLHLPFAFLPLGVAQWVHYGLNVLLIVAVSALALSACGIAPTAARVLSIAAALSLSRPGNQTLYLGQCTVYIVLACLAALYHARARPRRAGVWLAVACAKPTFGVPLAALLWCGGRRRAVSTAVLVTAVPFLALAAVLAARAGGMMPLWRGVVAGLHRVSADPAGDPATSLIRIDAAALVARVAGRPLGPAVEAALGLALLGLAGRGAARLARDEVVGSEPWLHGASVMVYAVLACTYHQAYDGMLLVLPAIALGSGRLFAQRPVVRRVLLALVVLQAVNYLATYQVVAALDLTGGLWLAVASMNGVIELAALGLLLGGGRAA